MAGASGPRDEAGQTMSLGSAVAHLNAISSGISVDPSEYSWGAPSLLQQQALYSQFLQLACSLPQLQLAQMASMQAGRGAFFPNFMPTYTVAPPCLSQAPSPAPSSPALPESSGQQQITKLNSASNKVGSPSKKSGSKAKTSKCTSVPCAPAAPALGAPKGEADMQLEDICRLLGDDSFLEHLQDDVLSEGSNGSSATNDGRTLSKNNSNGSLCASGSPQNNNDGGLLPGNNFASAFDLDMDEAPAPAAPCAGSSWVQPVSASAQLPAKANSGDLNNMLASSPVRSTRSGRVVAREAAATAKEPGKDGAAPTKVSLKVKGGVQKASGKPSGPKAASQQQQQAAVAAAAAAGPCPEDCQLTAADISRLLGEDDNGIPDGWDLDLDFQDPFSCSISV